jgi:hypothetical protein
MMKLQAFAPEQGCAFSPFHPRSPQQCGARPGKNEGSRARNSNMRTCFPGLKSLHKLFFQTLLFALVLLCMSAASFAQIGVAITVGPPALPVYDQPLCPGDGYLWTPGYWAYNYDVSDYYWVPGTWVLAPEVGYLWTPPYWGWGGDRFAFHEGYWGARIGFYGGINYGFGYFGTGFEGGRWDGGHFFYNRAVMNINVTNIHNVYNTTVIHETTVNRISYNGGRGGIETRATSEQEAAERERHIGPIAAQNEHAQQARSNPDFRASVNKGRPAIAATERPGDFKGRVAPGREAGENEGHAENNAPRPTPVHPHDLNPVAHPGNPNTGDMKKDQKYQHQQDQMVAKQQQERDKLQQKQEQDHQRMQKQNYNDQQRQQVEQRHQQQTQQLQQRHDQQQQHYQQKVEQSRPRK